MTHNRLVMEMLEKGLVLDLEDDEEPIWSEEEVLLWTKCAIKALIHLHSKDVCHGDFKLDSMMWRSSTSTFVLMDFDASIYPASMYTPDARFRYTHGWSLLYREEESIVDSLFQVDLVSLGRSMMCLLDPKGQQEHELSHRSMISYFDTDATTKIGLVLRHMARDLVAGEQRSLEACLDQLSS